MSKENFDLAIQNLKNKNINAAIKLFEKILKEDPNHLQSNFILGTVYAQNNNFEKAYNFLDKAIQIKPFFLEAHNNLGLLNMEQGNLKNATECFEKVININPNYSDAYNNLGMTLLKSGNKKNAKKKFEKAIEINQKHFQAKLNLGVLYIELKNSELAEKLINESIDINPKFLPSHINLIQLYEKLNEEEKLKKAINNAEVNLKNIPLIKLYKGKLLYRTGNFSEAINILESISFGSPQLILESTRCSTLAKSYDQLKKCSEAFKCFKKSNEIHIEINANKKNKNNFLKLINERKNFIQNFNIKEWTTPKTINDKLDPIFLIGFPRSGTTLLDTILRCHPSINVLEEMPIIENIIYDIRKKTNRDLNKLKTISENFLIELRNSYYDTRKKYIEKEDLNKTYIDKMPLNIIFVGEILRIFPNAKFILALRHPCDCVLSSFMQTFKLNDAMTNFLDLKDAANLYDSVMDLWTKYLKVFSINFYSVKYEDVVSEFDKTIGSILEFLELPWSDNVLNFHETAKKRGFINTPSYNQVIEPIYNKSVGKWKLYEKEMSSVHPILDPWIKKFNY